MNIYFKYLTPYFLSVDKLFTLKILLPIKHEENLNKAQQNCKESEAIYRFHEFH